MGAGPVLSLHQPHYFPWLGLLAKIACSDIFIFLDNVQFEKRGYQNRAQYSTPQGLKHLTLPVLQKGTHSEEREIREVLLNGADAGAKHFQTLSHRYGKRPGWKKISDRLEAILTAPHEKLISLCMATTMLTMEIYRVQPKVLLSSEMNVEGKKGERVVNLVEAGGGAVYLSGTGARNYLDAEAFKQAGLGLIFQEFKHPVYAQSAGDEFQPAAFALEWYIEEPERAVDAFHTHLRANENQPPRSIV